jgi:uncharacterized protein (TIGR02246 family)
MMTNSNQSADLASIRELLAQNAEAWNQHDAEAFGSAFSKDCHYIAFFGGIYRGQNEIIESHRTLWSKSLKGTRLFYEVLDIRFVTPDVAIIVTQGEVAKSSPKKLLKVQSYVAAKQDDGKWRFVHFQNTKTNKLMRFLTYMMGPSVIPSFDKNS